MVFQDPTTNLVGMTDEIQMHASQEKLWHFVLSIYPIDGIEAHSWLPLRRKKVPNLVGKI